MAKKTGNRDARQRGSGGVAANKRGIIRQQCNAAYPQEQSPGEGARSKPGYTLPSGPVRVPGEEGGS